MHAVDIDEPKETDKLVTKLAGELCQMLSSYCGDAELDKVRKACEFSAKAHEGQMRLSGEPFISHPLMVATTMAKLRMDCDSIVAGILHDTVEDTDATVEQIEEQFGAAVARIVEGVSKIEHLGFVDRQLKQARNIQKMMLAMTKDVRVILVKLADRLHNMRTICHLPTSKHRFIAKETLDIYAPIAWRLGINQMAKELENLGFSTLYPLRHEAVKRALDALFARHAPMLSKVQKRLSDKLREAGIKHTIVVRYKRPYSAYCKMRRKRRALSELHDIFALRIIVDKVDECFCSLGHAHGLNRPVPGHFKDYISLPKENGYQSLHTILVLPGVSFIEVQIRTKAMEQLAEGGIAAHVGYKSGEKGPLSANYLKVRTWASNILETEQKNKDLHELLEDVKLDFYANEVHVFTPQGEIVVLPHGARVIDFAFAVHTDMGLSCSAALIDKQRVSLSAVLRSGQTVEIKTSKSAHPEPEWLGFAMTSKARSAIRGYLKNIRNEQAIALGERLLGKALARRNLSLEGVAKAAREQLLLQLGCADMSSLFRKIGLGKQLPALVAWHLSGAQNFRHNGSQAEDSLAVEGSEGMMVNYARCCYPVPGDQICGKLSADMGLVVHRNSCHNLGRKHHKTLSHVPLHWSTASDREREYHAMVKVEAAHKRGVLAVVAERISESKSNIENIIIEERPGAFATMTFTLSVKSEEHLNRVLRRIRSASKDLRASRVS